MKTRRHIAAVLLLVTMLPACVSTNKEDQKPWEPEKRANAHVQLAIGYMQRNEMETAIEELEKALAVQPSNVAANHAMATAMQRLDKFSDAERYYRNAERYDPKRTGVLMDYGSLLCLTGRYEEAMQRFSRALEDPLNKNADLANMRAGACLMRVPDFRKAESFFRMALDLNPRLSPALLHMAKIKFQQKNFLSARAYLERFVETGQRSPEALLLAVKTERLLGANDVALQYAITLRKTFPQSQEAKELEKMKLN